MPLDCANAGGSCRAQQPSLPGMLRLQRPQLPTDFSWPKNTVNILGSVSLFPYGPGCKHSQADKLHTVLGTQRNAVFAPHEKLDLHPKPRRGTSGTEGYLVDGKKKSPNTQGSARLAGRAVMEQKLLGYRKVWRLLKHPSSSLSCLGAGLGLLEDFFTGF